MKKKTELKSCSFCGDSGQIIESKTGAAYLCAIYCADCLSKSKYIQPDTFTYGLSFLSRQRARKKAIKKWNAKWYWEETKNRH